MAQLSSGLLRRSAVNVVERRARRSRYARLGRLVLVIVGTRVSVTIVAGRRVGHGLSRPLRGRCTVDARVQFFAGLRVRSHEGRQQRGHDNRRFHQTHDFLLSTPLQRQRFDKEFERNPSKVTGLLALAWRQGTGTSVRRWLPPRHAGRLPMAKNKQGDTKPE